MQIYHTDCESLFDCDRFLAGNRMKRILISLLIAQVVEREKNDNKMTKKMGPPSSTRHKVSVSNCAIKYTLRYSNVIHKIEIQANNIKRMGRCSDPLLKGSNMGPRMVGMHDEMPFLILAHSGEQKSAEGEEVSHQEGEGKL